MDWLLAHAGEVHETTESSATHFLSAWYAALLTFVVIGFAVFTIAKQITGRTDRALSVLALVLLVAGFTTYNVSTLISVLSITFGIVIAGFLALVGLSTPQPKQKAEKS